MTIRPSYLRRARRAPVLLGLVASAAVVGCSDLPTSPTSPADTTGASQPALAVSFQSPPWVGCQSGTQPSGALYQICFPSDWNGDMVFWAHGYVAPQEPLFIPHDSIGGTPLSSIVNSLGYGYAASSYRRNGLAADVGVEDMEELVPIVDAAALPRYRYLVGASEGGLVSALSLERSGTPFNGGVVTCGPVGSFRGQINYIGDFRAVFDYFFPGLIPGDAESVPQEVRDDFFTTYVPAITAALAAHPHATEQLLAVTGAKTDADDPTTVAKTTIAVLWYNVFATDDAMARLGGNPYDNRYRWYSGSDNDLLLNLKIKRYTASATALANLSAFETSGALKRPAQSLHTTGDPIVPWWHQPLYEVKVITAGSGLELISVPVDRYGHCAFTQTETLASFAALVLRVTGFNLVASADAFPGEPAREEFLGLARQQHAAPVLVDPARWQQEARRQLGLQP
jgi:hypothetical protein